MTKSEIVEKIAQGEDSRQGRKGKICFSEAQGRHEQAGGQLAEKAGGDGIRVFTGVDHEYTGIADAGQNCHNIAGQVSGLYACM